MIRKKEGGRWVLLSIKGKEGYRSTLSLTPEEARFPPGWERSSASLTEEE